MIDPIRNVVTRALALALAAGLLAGCATPAAPRAVAIGSDLRLPADVPVALPDRSTLVYRGLAEDSRCPRHVQCIHAGSVQVLFAHDAGRGPVALRIEAPRMLSIRFGAGWRLELTDVAGATPRAIDLRIEPAP